MSLPTTLDGLTASWLGAALERRYPGVEVTSLEILDVSLGNTTRVRVRLAYNAVGREAQLPETMFIKASFDEDHRATAGKAYVNEALFYQKLAPGLTVETPRCFFAGADASLPHAIIVLEDLASRGCRFGRGSDVLGVEALRSLLDHVAALHARWWDRALPHEEFDRSALALAAGVHYLVSAETWDWFLSRPARRAIQDELPAPLRGRERAAAAARAMLAGWRTGPQCLLHGDLHPGNLYYEPEGRPGLLDWQGFSGPWAHDVSYLVVGGLESEERRKCERDLLDYYLAQLTSQGAHAPTFDEAWEAYRRHLMWGVLWITCPETMQDEDVCLTQAGRFARAAVELGTFEALARACK